MKRAEAWTEEVTYVECPECGECIDLGADIVIGDDCEAECPKCAEAFKVEVPT